MQTSTDHLTQLQLALAALAKATHFKISLVESFVPRLHAKIEVNGQVLNVSPAFFQADRLESLVKIKNNLKQSEFATLHIFERLSEAMSVQCRALELNYLDLAGNAYLNLDSFFLSVQGQKTDKSALPKSKGVNSPSHIRMVYALLTQPALLNASYRNIADAAQIALGTVGCVFYDLSQRGFILEGTNRKERVLLAKTKLQQEWAINYPTKLRPKLNPQRFISNDPNWWETIDLSKYQAAWGAEVAAKQLTNALKPQNISIYIQTNSGINLTGQLVRDARLRADPQGNIEILESFWTNPSTLESENTVHPLLVYSDLNTAHDSRSLEAAQLIHDQFLAHD